MSDYRAEYVISLKDLYTKVSDKMDQSTRRLEGGIDKVNDKTGRLGKTAKRVGGMLVAAFSIAAVRSFAQQTEEAFLSLDRMNQQLNFAFGSKAQGAEGFAYARKTAYDLGLELENTAGSYARIAAAARGTSLEGKGAQDIFDGVAVASAGMRLSGEETAGAMRALEQILSKGKVQAEELRGQLGERIPGAFQIAARSMSMTTKELDKFMSDGKLVSEEFLPRFAAQLKTEFGDAAVEASTTATAAFNRQKSEIFELSAAIGQEAVPVMHAFRHAQLMVLKVISKGIEFYKENRNWINAVLVTVGLLTAAYYINAAAQAFMAIQSGVLTVSLWAQAAASGALITSIRMIGIAINTALGPIGWISLALSALVGVVTWAWNTFEGFRGAVMGTWEVIKQFGQNVWGFVKTTFAPFLEAWAQFKAGNYGAALKALGHGLVNTSLPGLMVNATSAAIDGDFTKGIADAYAKGDKEGRESFRKDKAKEAAGGAGVGEFGPGDGSGEFGADQSAMSATTKASTVQAKTPTNIYINIDTLGDIKLTTNTLKEGVHDIKKQVQEALLIAVNESQLAVK